jgi:hypothetical protein
MPDGWQAGLQPGINEVDPADPRFEAMRVGSAARKPSESVTYPLDVDIGEVAPGHHLIVTSISLTGESLLFDFAFAPEVPEDARGELWPNMHYGADVSPRGWSQAWSDAEVYERPVPAATYAWFDFFPPDFDWLGHIVRRGEFDSDYLRNRIARLTFNLKTGQSQIDK